MLLADYPVPQGAHTVLMSSECELSPDTQAPAIHFRIKAIAQFVFPGMRTLARAQLQIRALVLFMSQGQYKNHKSIHCPHHPLDRPSRPQRPYTTR